MNPLAQSLCSLEWLPLLFNSVVYFQAMLVKCSYSAHSVCSTWGNLFNCI